MKQTAGFALLLSTLLACGSEPPPPANNPESTSAANTAPTASAVPVSEIPKAPPPAEVYNFGKKAPAAGAKLTDKVTIEAGKDEKRVEERKIEVVTSDDKSITKEKVTLTSFDFTFKGKASTPNKSAYGKALTVEAGKDGATVTDDKGKPASLVDKFVATRRGPHVGEPLPGLLAFGERPLKAGDVVDGDKIGRFVSEISEWKDENFKTPGTVQRDFTGSKATLKSVENGIATFDVDVKEKVADGAGQFSLDVEYTGTVAVKMSDSMASKADLKTKGALKIKDMPGPGGKKINLDLPIEQTITFERKWE